MPRSTATRPRPITLYSGPKIGPVLLFANKHASCSDNCFHKPAGVIRSLIGYSGDLGLGLFVFFLEHTVVQNIFLRARFKASSVPVRDNQ